mmetsp:Transcript_7923/g.14365  ORF Transcript_7923/g.14365 Transcript_7923/m.14365 type:complete len:234 (-) Transcript_7923:797-1498(-)|eukprot:CAMPEP_0182447164 /NCGR_PEP_ID=MMETSP1172-20130603/12290_1 /TAXON_ID=708627 /ORGANISM="Timspurckia oligopyrenoides, Strain CCMP3278" /LENGTH=233 /DNA_ID=CAMNT_0024643499 /DNA_START=73 /DNA_END=774 /DNA_ORIENTATION=+
MARIGRICATLLVSLWLFSLVVEAVVISPVDEVAKGSKLLEAVTSSCPDGSVAVTAEAMLKASESMRASMKNHFSDDSIETAVKYMYKIASKNGLLCWGTVQGIMLNSFLDILSPPPTIVSDPSSRVKSVDRLDVLAPSTTCDFTLFGLTWNARNAAVSCEVDYSLGLFSDIFHLYSGSTISAKMADCYTSKLEPDSLLRSRCTVLEELPVFYYCGSDYTSKYEDVFGGVCTN